MRALMMIDSHCLLPRNEVIPQADADGRDHWASFTAVSAARPSDRNYRLSGSIEIIFAFGAIT
jgi:hypothetical protein